MVLGALSAMSLSLFHPWKFFPGIVGAGNGMEHSMVVNLSSPHVKYIKNANTFPVVPPKTLPSYSEPFTYSINGPIMVQYI